MGSGDATPIQAQRAGQSRAERTPPELRPEHARLEERSTEDLLEFTRRFASLVHFYGPDDAREPAGDWAELIPEVGPSLERYLAREAGRVPPHLALLLAFFELYRHPREAANDLTAQHLDFYYRRVLRLAPRPRVPDRAHLLLELKKGSEPASLGPEHRFTAGKDASGVERLYAPVRETVVNAGRVESLRSVHRGTDGVVRFAPIADSADGLGGAFAGPPRWPAFGHGSLPAAEVGFAVASPALRMREGERSATLTLELEGLPAEAAETSLAGAVRVYLTGEKGWLEPTVSAALLDPIGRLEVSFRLAASEAAVADYDAALHGYAYVAHAPIVQVVLTQAAGEAGYALLGEARVATAAVAVEVRGMRPRTLSGDAGGMDPAKPFQPFGPQPGAGARLQVGAPEALGKRLEWLELALDWQDVPNASLATHYAGYFTSPATPPAFEVRATARDAAGSSGTRVGSLFDAADARLPHEFALTFGGGAPSPPQPPAPEVSALARAGTRWARMEAAREKLRQPVLAAVPPAPPAPREGFVTLELLTGFLHAEFRRLYVAKAIEAAREGGDPGFPNDPYTPTLRSLTLSYRAVTGSVPVSSTERSEFAREDLHFFHLTPFGPRREHGYARTRLPFVGSPEVPLLPPVEPGGQLLVGLAGVGPGDSASLLVQVAEGSADPDLLRADVRWSVLCDNHWKPLDPYELVLDTTNRFLRSGLVRVVVPRDATTENTVLPSGPVWLRAALRGDTAAVSQLVRVEANAIEVRFLDRGNDPSHLESALPAGSITRLRTPVAAVKSVTQPYASHGGTPREADEAFRTRSAERLRHRGRALTLWDYERLVLEAFPGVHKVKCIPHASVRSWNAPGHVTVVVIPDLRNDNAVDPLRPRVDADTLARIQAFLEARSGPQVRIVVRNPEYRRVRLRFGVAFRRGYEFNHSRAELERSQKRLLSPWAYDPEHDIPFSGDPIYRSVMIDAIETLASIDYVTGFEMLVSDDEGEPRPATTDPIRPGSPATILVSDAVHDIVEAP